MLTNGVWIAEMESETFSWKAVGKTQEDNLVMILSAN